MRAGNSRFADGEGPGGESRGPLPGSETAPIDDSPSAAFDRLTGEIKRACSHIETLFAVKIDVVKARARRLAFLAAAGALAGALLIVLASAAVVFLLDGLSGGLGQALGGREWLGRTVVAGATLALLAMGVWILLKKLTRVRAAILRKYPGRVP